MRDTGTAPCWRTVSLSFFAYSVKIDFSRGWIGHWLQSIMIARSNGRSVFSLKMTLFWSSNEYAPSAFGLKYEPTSCQPKPEPLTVTETPLSLEAGAADRRRCATIFC